MKTEIFLQVLRLVSAKTGINEQTITSMERTEEALDARAMAVYLCRKCGLSNKDVRILFGRAGHHFTQRMYDLCESRKQFNRYYSSLCAAISKQLGINA